MAPTLICGAECGIITVGLPASSVNTHWDGVAAGGGTTISTSVVRSGSRSFSCAANASGAWLAHRVAASQTIGYGRCYFQITANPASIISGPLYFITAAGGDAAIFISTGGVIGAGYGSASQTGPTMVANEWYGVEVEVDLRANPNLMNWRTWSASTGWVNQTQVSVGQAATTLTAANGISVGLSVTPASGVTMYVDDVILGSGTTQGADYSATVPRGGKCLRLVTNGDGNHNIAGTPEFAIAAAGADIADSSTIVNTYVNDDDQTVITGNWVRQKIAAAGAYCAITFPDVTTPVGAVAVTSTHHSAGTGANHQSIRISDDNWSNETQVWILDDVSDTTAHYRHKIVATPPSGGSWTAEKLSSTEIRFGYATDVSAIPYYDSISIEYEEPEARVTQVFPYPQLLAQ